MTDFIYPDSDPMNRDWTKQTWDIFDREGLIDSIERLRRYLGNDPVRIAEFKKLPAYILVVNKPGMEWLRDL